MKRFFQSRKNKSNSRQQSKHQSSGQLSQQQSQEQQLEPQHQSKSNEENVIVDDTDPHVVTITTSKKHSSHQQHQQSNQVRPVRKRASTLQTSNISVNSSSHDDVGIAPPPPPLTTNSSSSSNGVDLGLNPGRNKPLSTTTQHNSSSNTTPMSMNSKGNFSATTTSTTLTNTTSGNNTIKSSSHHSHRLPGIFTLIEQGKWKRVCERAKKYPRECQKTAHIKRKSSTISSISPRRLGSTTKDDMNTTINGTNHRLGLTSTPSYISTTTLDTMKSQQTNCSTSTFEFITVKCKALHHACYKLRNIHSQIHRAISNEIEEMNQYYAAYPDHLHCDSGGGLGSSLKDCHDASLSFMNGCLVSPSSTPKVKQSSKSKSLLSANSPNATTPTGASPATSPTTNFNSQTSPTSSDNNNDDDEDALTAIPSCLSSCSCGFSFDDNDTNETENVMNINQHTNGGINNHNNNPQGGSQSPIFDSIVNTVKSNISTSPTSQLQKNRMNEEWDDPWIDACEAILTILEVYPEAAQIRETRHGCLPLHLAVFAMRPTPVVPLPDEYIKYKYHYSKRKASCIDETLNHIDEVSHKKLLAASNNSDDINNDGSSSLMTLPPRPMTLASRGKSNSSAVSMGSQHSSLAGMTTIFTDGGGCSIGGASANSADSFQQDIIDSMVNIEERLRNKGSMVDSSSNNSKKQCAGLITTEEESQLLERCSRPAPISSSHYDRNTSLGSTASSTAYSLYSTVPPSTNGGGGGGGASPHHQKVFNEFYLDKYIANAEKRAQYSLRVFNAILNAHVEAISTDSEGGRYPLHNAIVGRASFDIIETLIKMFPPVVRSRTKDGSLPLHLAAYYGVSDPRVVPILLRHYPYAAAGKNKWDRTPLEEALLLGGENGRKHQIELIAALRQPVFYWTNPKFDTEIDLMFSGEEGAIEKRIASIDGDSDNDDENDMCLTTLIKKQKWDFIVKNIDRFVFALHSPLVTTGKGGYKAKLSALHLVCEYDPTYEILDALVSACPTACAFKMQPGGQLPLHVAATWKSSESVIGFLLAANPDAAKQKDWLGNLPLHCACLSGASTVIIESLLCSYPLAVNERNKQDSTPAAIVKRLSHNNKTHVLLLLERTTFEVAKAKQRKLKAFQFSADKTKTSFETTSTLHGRRKKKPIEEHRALCKRNDSESSDDDDQNWV